MNHLSLTNTLSRFFDIRSGEARRVGIMVSLLFFLLAADVLVNFRFSIVRDSFIGGAAHAAAKPGI